MHHAAQFGTATGPAVTDMAKVRRRMRDMVNREIDFHLQQYKTTGAELIMGTGRFVATERSWSRGRPTPVAKAAKDAVLGVKK